MYYLWKLLDPYYEVEVEEHIVAREWLLKRITPEMIERRKKDKDEKRDTVVINGIEVWV